MIGGFAAAVNPTPRRAVAEQPAASSTRVEPTTTTAAPTTATSTTPPSCHPNYSGCVPIDSDVDCAGGSGDGPSYVRGPIRVLGADVDRLDANHDGTASE